MTNFDLAIKFVFAVEGGYVNDPRGGSTNMGITQNTLNEYRTMVVSAPSHVKDLTKDIATDIYLILFWERFKCDQLPKYTSIVIFDGVVNMGANMIRLVQAHLRIKTDGGIGPVTIASIKSVKNDSEFADELIACQEGYYIGLNDLTFLKGWLDRSLKLKEYIYKV